MDIDADMDVSVYRCVYFYIHYCILPPNNPRPMILTSPRLSTSPITLFLCLASAMAVFCTVELMLASVSG